MTPDEILRTVCGAIDVLVDAGRAHDGLLPSMLDLRTGEMLADAPEPIPGQRPGDRAYRGSNLIHDEPTLRTMLDLADVAERPDYADAADRYLRRFATHCTDTATGLFPWGEHAYWDLSADRVGDSGAARHGREPSDTAVHDHLRAAPLWLWEKLAGCNPQCVERFAEGLDWHWQGDRDEYVRHAFIQKRQRYGSINRSCDFPRHGGFYIFDWTFAYLQAGRDDFVAQIVRMLDYWWPLRDDDGLLMIESRTPPDVKKMYRCNAPGQTLSLGLSLIESADLLDAAGKVPELTRTMRERAKVYTDAFLAAPHDFDAGVYPLLFNRDTGEITSQMPVWGSVYGVDPLARQAVLCAGVCRLTGDDRQLDWAVRAGREYLAQDPPDDAAVPAMDAGLALELMCELHELTGDDKWLARGRELSERLVDIYFAGALPRLAPTGDWYESQAGPGFLLHGLTRVALLTRDGQAVGGDYTAR